MPTVLRVGSLRFVIWPNDHSPAHVHVFSADGEAKIEINAGGHPRLIDNRRMKASDLATSLKAVSEHRVAILKEWNDIHG
jgi:hypothetical protein